MSRRCFVAGNWKMNKTPDEARALAAALRTALGDCRQADVAVCPPFVCLHAVADALKGSPIGLGAQNIHWEKSGAYTGEISGAMLLACGCRYAIVGHSERRQWFGETDETVNKRLNAALAAGLLPIVCVGETLDERKGNITAQTVTRQVEKGLAGLTAAQMANVTLAYEPVWAIGTGVVATPDQAQEVHALIRGLLKKLFGADVAEAVRIQYGGSVAPDNAASLLSKPDIDGALVGGASLDAGKFFKIVAAAKA